MKLTIIIPAYNAADTLADAIESVLVCFENQEILIIDDGSKDSTGEICDRYEAEYENVSVVHTENGGVSRARNLGIEKATGDYIMFMDADDRIIYDGTLELDTDLEECDMILFSFIERKMNGKPCNTFIFEEKQINKLDIPDAFLNNKYSFYGPWAKIYKKDIIMREGLRFNAGQKYGEDVVFVLSYLSRISKGIYLSPNVFYAHYINPNGASFYKQYYSEMNVYLFNQLKAFEAMACAMGKADQSMLTDFACSLFNETILHYYQRINKEIFFAKYMESYGLFSPYLAVTSLRKYSLFRFLGDDNAMIADPAIIEKVYQKNLLRKVKYECKKIIYNIF